MQGAGCRVQGVGVHLAVMSRGAAPSSHEGEGKEDARSATMMAPARDT